MYYKELRAGKNSVTESIIFDPDLSSVDYSKEFKLPEYGNENARRELSYDYLDLLA